MHDQQNVMLTISLNLSFEAKGRAAEGVINIYFYNQMIADLDQLAWNLCECDDQRQSSEIGTIALKSCQVARKNSGQIHVKASITMTGNNEFLAAQMIQEYLDGFSDYIRPINLGYESRSGSRTGFFGEILEQNYEIRPH